MTTRRRRGAATRVFLVTVLLAGAALAVAACGALGLGSAGDAHPAQTTGAGAASVPSRPAEAFPITVTAVHDGDTLRAVAGEPHGPLPAGEEFRVRLLEIDTPEVPPQDEECWGAQATAELTALLPPGSTAWAAFDDDPVDPYDRFLLYLWTEDGAFVNHALVASGAAEVLVIAPNDAYADVLAEAESAARASSAGQWGACG